MTTAPRRFLPYLALGVVWVVWGSTYLAMRVAVSEMPPFGAAAVRFGAAAAVARARKGRPAGRQALLTLAELLGEGRAVSWGAGEPGAVSRLAERELTLLQCYIYEQLLTSTRMPVQPAPAAVAAV